MAAPHMDKAAPASVTHKTRGRRTFRMMFFAIFSGMGNPRIAFHTAVTVSEKEILTLPTQTHRIIVRKSTVIRRKYVRRVNCSRFSCLLSCMGTSWKTGEPKPIRLPGRCVIRLPAFPQQRFR